MTTRSHTRAGSIATALRADSEDVRGPRIIANIG